MRTLLVITVWMFQAQLIRFPGSNPATALIPYLTQSECQKARDVFIHAPPNTIDPGFYGGENEASDCAQRRVTVLYDEVYQQLTLPGPPPEKH